MVGLHGVINGSKLSNKYLSVPGESAEHVRRQGSGSGSSTLKKRKKESQLSKYVKAVSGSSLGFNKRCSDTPTPHSISKDPLHKH